MIKSLKTMIFVGLASLLLVACGQSGGGAQGRKGTGFRARKYGEDGTGSQGDSRVGGGPQLAAERSTGQIKN